MLRHLPKSRYTAMFILHVDVISVTSCVRVGGSDWAIAGVEVQNQPLVWKKCPKARCIRAPQLFLWRTVLAFSIPLVSKRHVFSRLALWEQCVCYMRWDFTNSLLRRKNRRGLPPPSAVTSSYNHKPSKLSEVMILLVTPLVAMAVLLIMKYMTV